MVGLKKTNNKRKFTMKKLSILMFLGCVFIGNFAHASTLQVDECADPRCSYERKDPRSNTIMHFDQYGNLLGRTIG